MEELDTQEYPLTLRAAAYVAEYLEKFIDRIHLLPVEVREVVLRFYVAKRRNSSKRLIKEHLSHLLPDLSAISWPANLFLPLRKSFAKLIVKYCADTLLHLDFSEIKNLEGSVLHLICKGCHRLTSIKADVIHFNELDGLVFPPTLHTLSLSHSQFYEEFTNFRHATVKCKNSIQFLTLNCF